MKKSSLLKTTLAMLLSVSLIGLMFTGCKPLSGPETTSFTVTFDSDGGSAVEAQTVKDGGYAERPESPTKTGFNFVNWFAPDAETAFDFATPITADITLKAKWSAQTFTVTFDSDEGSDVAPAIVKYGEKVAKPTDPVKAGFIFSGWFNGETEFNFDTPVTGNLTLKAKWVSEDNAVSVSIKIGDKEVKKVTVEKGEKIAKPEITSDILTTIGKTDLKGYVTWAFDFATAVSESTTITGTWHDVTGYVNTNPFNLVDASAYSGFYLIPIDPAKPAADWGTVSVKAKCLALDGTVVTAAAGQAQFTVAKTQEDWSNTGKLTAEYNLGSTAAATTATIPNGTDSVTYLVIQRTTADLDKVAYIEVTEITWGERTAEVALTSTGYVEFTEIPGFPADFDPDNYSQIWITVRLLDANGESLVADYNECSGDLFGNGKICLNDCTDPGAEIISYGWGNGFQTVYLNNTYWKGSFDSSNPDHITIQFNAVEEYGTAGYTESENYKNMNCVSAQLDGSLKKIVFLSFGGQLKQE